jgi:hypothetical protein
MTERQFANAVRYAKDLANEFQCRVAIYHYAGRRPWQCGFWYEGDIGPCIMVIEPEKRLI